MTIIGQLCRVESIESIVCVVRNLAIFVDG